MATPRKTTQKTASARPSTPSPKTFAEIGRDAAREAQRKGLLAALKAADWNLTATGETLGLGGAGNVLRAIHATGLDEEYEAAKQRGKIGPGSRRRDS